MSKLDKKIIGLTETILSDATDAQKTAWIGMLSSLIKDEDSPQASPVKKRKNKKGESPSPSPDASPAEDESPAESPESPAESPEEDASPEESPEESPVKKSKGKDKKKGKEVSPEEDESPAESPEEDESPAESPEEDASPEEDESPAESPESPVKKSSKDKKKSSKSEEDEDEDSGTDYSSMSERALVKHLTEEKNIPAATVKPIKADKKKLIKLAKGYDELFAKYSVMKLAKLEKLVANNDIKVTFGRGRSNDEKKIRIISETLAANGIA